MKLWKKDVELDKQVEKFTVGNDYLLDMKLLKHDLKASIAHANMLCSMGILSEDEKDKIVLALNEIEKFGLVIEQCDEDCHTAIEKELTKKLGDLGKKIHTGRSRNDQVLVALRLYEKEELVKIKEIIEEIKKSLVSKKKEFKGIIIPGYTHMQKAMPLGVGIWFDVFTESFSDDLLLLDSTLKIIDKSPLGTAAGFGTPGLDIDQEMTSTELGFEKPITNPLYAQMTRGKYESSIMNLLVQLMYTANKFASDMMIFTMSEFNYFTLPKELTTGSSIMPQKKNMDLIELLRAKYSIILGEEVKVKNLISNIISGYNRDVQLLKEPIMNSFETVQESLQIMKLIIDNLICNKEVCKKALTPELYATEEAYKLVKEGMPFRDAYKKIGAKYE